MRITVEIPVVAECGVVECTYNAGHACHAKAITIGDSVHPGCDTFLLADEHIHARKQRAGVGACKISACSFNVDFECGADAIRVGHAGQDVHCLTFMQR
ncbi:MAG: DUF1540 domain-containing protein [Pseudomonadota bacterium]